MSSDVQMDIERLGYLGDANFIEKILKTFFLEIEEKLLKWQKEGVSEEVARHSVNESIANIAKIFKGENPAYLSMPAWNGEPLAFWIKKNVDLPFPEGVDGLEIIDAYFTILTATFMQGWQAYQMKKLDAAQWGDWTGAMRRKMRLQLIGAPG
ncbi:hypothetical protein FAI41_08015 [Acetobacteraceae bacterium]|nr:hypothetical protein FAI41_08015 [Acetobacteraceae bacterium]